MQAALAAGFIEELPQALRMSDLPNVTIADVRDANFTWGLSWNFHPEMMENNELSLLSHQRRLAGSKPIY